MKILLTGTTGYIGQRLLPVLLNKGHEVICCVRDRNRFNTEKYQSGKVTVIEVNFLEKETLQNIPEDIDIAYYMIHSMSSSIDKFEEMEALSAVNFKSRLEQTKVKQVIYLSGIVNDDKLSKHLKSRKRVEEILSGSTFNLTTLRAGIIVGSGSASFEIIRDLVEKLPVMIAPKWLNSRSQPLAVRNVIEFLTGVILREETFNQSFDIGGPEVLTYKQMLLQFAEVRGLKRTIISVPVMTPKLSSYWLYFVTSTSYKLAVNLVNSMKVEIICRENNLREILGIELLTYKQAVQSAFDRIAQQEVLSSWTDALASNALQKGVSQLLEVPTHGCYKDYRQKKIADENKTLTRIWTIGGKKGWYYANWLWKLRGFVDKLFGGVGLRRGRKSADNISTGESLDFWRVLYANRSEKRLLLFAEMKLPGEAWLEFKIKDNVLYQTATFRPLGLFGRMYWYGVMPFHGLIFNGMINKLAEAE
ncbi:MAG: SDR family oxidoreductase [Bacteroidetes bacterium]|nr:MAG: SDR family oxidoreductase [Bacteroidota bacterium]